MNNIENIGFANLIVLLYLSALINLSQERSLAEFFGKLSRVLRTQRSACHIFFL
jgi:hypothetical protein